MREWIGIGPSASSQYRGMRYTNVASLERWAMGIEKNRPERTDIVPLSEKLLAIDKIIFGLRMNAGVDLSENIFRDTISPLLADLESENLLTEENRRIRLTPQGRLLCDAIAQEIFNNLD
jgi:oxygen-independent coproporphyrinogen-3 oxidase